jgi:large subunit ribosomal protein L1
MATTKPATAADRILAKRGKRYRSAASRTPQTAVAVDAAVALLKGFDQPKFDQSVELIFNLGVDPAHADQAIRSSISLPHGIGKSKRVVAFTSDPGRAQACLDAGAIRAGGEELVGEIEKSGFSDFDVAIATPDMMRFVGRLGKTLGPKGLMPAPKAGTVTPDIENAVKEYAAGKVEFRTDKQGNVHTVVGKVSFDNQKLTENINAMVDRIKSLRPAAAKGLYIRKAVLKGSMTPAVPLQVA